MDARYRVWCSGSMYDMYRVIHGLGKSNKAQPGMISLVTNNSEIVKAKIDL